MKLPIFIISLCIAGTLCEYSMECYNREGKRCDFDLFPDKVPETVDELKTACNNIITVGTCATGVEEACGDSPKRLAGFHNGLSFVKSSCQEDSPIFKAVAENLDCIGPAITTMHRTCSFLDISHTSYATITSKAKELTGGSENQELFRCLNFFLYGTCKELVIGEECGDEVKSTVVDILENTDVDLWTCLTEFPEEWEVLHEVFEAVIHEERRIENALKESEE